MTDSHKLPSIRSRLALLVMACVVPASLMAAFVIYHYFQVARADLANDSIATARAMTSALDRDLAGVESSLLSLASCPHLHGNDLAMFYDHARDVLQHLHASNILVADTRGQQVMNTRRPFGDALPSYGNIDQLREVITTRRPNISGLFIGSLTREPLVSIAVPVVHRSDVTGVLSSSIVPERLAAILTQQRLPAGWTGTIYDGSGTIVARTHRMSELIGTKAAPELLRRMSEVTEGVVNVISEEDVAVLSVFSRSAVSNWTVGMAIPEGQLLAQLSYSLLGLVAATLALLTGGLAIAWILANRISGSIRALAAPALALGSGQAFTAPRLRLRETAEVGKALSDASRMLSAAQHQAHHDALTGLANRALFTEILERQIATSRRTGNGFSLLYVDLDGFKAVNDRHGHAIGDAFLREIATRLKAGIREADVAARLGGDEFAVVLVDSGAKGAEAVAAKLTQDLAQAFETEEAVVAVSASIGVATFPDAAATCEALLQRADEAMYEAKRAGKDRYAVAPARI